MNNKYHFRVSEAGRCPRALSAQLLNMEAIPKPSFVEMAAKEGIIHEKLIIADLRDQGYVVLNTRNPGSDEQVEVSIEQPRFWLTGHLDGEILNWSDDQNDKGTEHILLEIKTMSPFEYSKWRRKGFQAFPNYAAQISLYMDITEIQKALYIVKDRSSGNIDKPLLTAKPADVDKILAKLDTVCKYVDRGQLVPAEYDVYSTECQRCEYRNWCILPRTDLPRIDEALLMEATNYVREGLKLKNRGEVLYNQGKATLQRYTEDNKLGKWFFNDIAIHMYPVHRENYEKAKLLEMFSEEQLSPALKVSDYMQLRLEDIRSREDEDTEENENSNKEV